MSEEKVIFYNSLNEFDDELNINLKKYWLAIWSRKWTLIKIFSGVLIFFILLTFILPKKYKVTADLFINKTNNSNISEFNPYVLDEASSSMFSMAGDKAMNNEIELIKSSLVLDKVIRDNNIVYKKKYGIIPNKKEGEYLSAKDFIGKGKSLKIENTKGTSIIHIEYKSKKPELAYGIVTSMIENYISVHKELNSEKSKADKLLLEKEYANIKKSLNEKLAKSSGLPVQTMTGTGNLTALSAFSKSAASAISSIRGQYFAGERSQLAISEESQKAANIASKLEWARMVEQMSDLSKVRVLNSPALPRPFENTSPKLFTNIILGCIIGYLSALTFLVYKELFDKRLTYSMLTENIIFDGVNDTDSIISDLIAYVPEPILFISLTELPKSFCHRIEQFPNAKIIYANLSSEFVKELSGSNKVMLISKLQYTSSDFYKKIRNIIQKQKKEVIKDILM